MKIFLIGKTGQVGSCIFEEAKQAGYQVIAPSREELDVRNEEGLERTLQDIRPNVIINTSAYHVLADCEKKPQEAFHLNCLVPYNLARIAKKTDSCLVTYSTDYVFNGEKRSPYEEADRPQPLQVYGLSKLGGEYACLAEYPEGVLLIRTAGVYGGHHGGHNRGGNIAMKLFNRLKHEGKVEAGADFTVSTTYAPDLARGTIELLKKGVRGGIYHLVNEGFCNWYDFALTLQDFTKVGGEVIPVLQNGFYGGVKRPQYSVLSNAKTKGLDIKMPYWEDSLRIYTEFLKQA